MKRYFSSAILIAIFALPLHAQTVDEIFDQEAQKNSETIEKERKEKQKDLKPSGERAQFQFSDANARPYSLDTMAAVDAVMEWDKNRPHTTTNQSMIRTGEIGFYSAIDQLADGVLTLAAHNEGGALKAEVHEAYFQMPGTLIPRTTIRVGRMFPDAGRLNGFHQHDWPFITTPIVHQQLLDKEGILDTGAEFRFLMPWPFWQELTIGAFNGRVFGHADSAGPMKNNPLVNVHLKQFLPISDNWGTQFGFTYLRWHPDPEPGTVSHQYGLDYMLKYKKGKLSSFQWITEVWHRKTTSDNHQTNTAWIQNVWQPNHEAWAENPDFQLSINDLPAKANPIERTGTYTYLEWQPFERWAFGTRYDFLYTPSMRETDPLTGVQHRKRNGTEEESLILTWRPSEFSVFRGQASTTIDLETGRRTYQYYLQATFIIGKHPAHVY